MNKEIKERNKRAQEYLCRKAQQEHDDRISEQVELWGLVVILALVLGCIYGWIYL